MSKTLVAVRGDRVGILDRVSLGLQKFFGRPCLCVLPCRLNQGLGASNAAGHGGVGGGISPWPISHYAASKLITVKFPYFSHRPNEECKAIFLAGIKKKKNQHKGISLKENLRGQSSKLQLLLQRRFQDLRKLNTALKQPGRLLNPAICNRREACSPAGRLAKKGWFHWSGNTRPGSGETRGLRTTWNMM